MEICISPIGIIKSPFEDVREAPRQGNKEILEIEIFEDFKGGLKDIDDFSCLHIFYWLHKSETSPLEVRTPWDPTPHGVFATRSPNRPNSIGHSVVELLERNDNVLKVRGLDAIDGTPVLDIKPYLPGLDSEPEARTGWFEKEFGSESY